VISAEIPPGSRFKGDQSFLVQDLVISVRATHYQRERWVAPGGRTILAPLPEGIEGHFGPELRRFVLMQYYQGQSTMPRLPARGLALRINLTVGFRLRASDSLDSKQWRDNRPGRMHWKNLERAGKVLRIREPAMPRCMRSMTC
jgi:hypothetical protein